MFNRSPACDFWRRFFLEHDSYLSIDGTEEYALSLAQELAQLTCLRILRLGVYITPSSAVLAHRLYHIRGLPAPAMIDWQQAIPLAQIPPIQGNETPELEPASSEDLVSLLHQPSSEPDFGPETCSLCVEEILDISQAAESNANQILKQLVPSLEIVEWMGWFTPGHLGSNTHSF
ncbi:hypothetical protein BDV93DRAFT_560140 [Ceratobasidium sp. AG-I]|nr:hypothetical protein BDV93DRAFT_560140 [Ceratobasidium sp. AG-I]